MKTHLVIPDSHAHPSFNNERATLIGKFIADIKPDVVVNMGDQWDFPSLSSYDKGKRSFNGRSYKADLEAGLDFSERLWAPIRKLKKKLPRSIFLEGNHEQRMERVLDNSPELVGTVGWDDLDLSRNYDEVIRYNGGTPGIVDVDGVHYAHYFVSGIMGRGISGEHPAYSLITKHLKSCTTGHLHVADWAVRTTVDGKKIMGLSCGVCQDYDSPWAGEINKLWWRGVVLKTSVENGTYDPAFISLNTLKKMYG